MKDRIFIFLTVVLLILFAARIFSNIEGQIEQEEDGLGIQPEEDISGVLTMLDEAGLEPREAEYYKIIP